MPISRPLFKQDAPLILASGSPRRRELLAGCGIGFKVVVSGCEEEGLASESPEDMVRRLACDKAEFVAAQYPSDWVLGADTDVLFEGKVLGKPESPADAERMLASMQGREHLVWGGFALVNREKGITRIESHFTKVRIAAMSPDFIKAYVATGEPLDKAGAYAAQGIGAAFISGIEGSYTNVVGLNLEVLVSTLLELRIIRP